MSIDDINKFLAHLYKTSIDVARREQDKRPIPYDITIFTNGETLALPFDIDTFEALRVMLVKIRKPKNTAGPKELTKEHLLYKSLDLEEYTKKEIADIEYLADRVEVNLEYIDDGIHTDIDREGAIRLAKQYKKLKTK